LWQWRQKPADLVNAIQILTVVAVSAVGIDSIFLKQGNEMKDLKHQTIKCSSSWYETIHYNKV
jgi:hypothetical protein